MPRALPHFKVFTSFQNHRKTTGIWADNDLLALWLRIGVLAIERFADRTCDTFSISARELLALTGKGRADVARKSLERLADFGVMSFECSGQVYRITLCNFAKRQGFNPKNGKTRVPPSSSASTSYSVPKKEQRRKTVSAPSEEAERAPPADPERWANVLAREPGTRAEKVAWLRSDLDLIYAEADASFGAEHPTAKARAQRRRSLVIRWYRQHLRNPHHRKEGHHGAGYAAAFERLEARADRAAAAPLCSVSEHADRGPGADRRRLPDRNGALHDRDACADLPQNARVHAIRRSSRSTSCAGSAGSSRRRGV